MIGRYLKDSLIPLFLLGTAPGMIHAQSFYNNNSVVSVLPGTIFSVKDSLINTGTFINNGNLVIGGTWLNTGSYNPGEGEITFNSSSPTTPQIINHSNQSFSKLTISGGGTKRILADITVEDELILSDGIIEAENGARVVINPSAIVAGGSDQAHVHAPVYHHGSGNKLFPMGNGSIYLPVSLLNISDASSLIGVEGIELESASLPKAPSLDEISTTRYWHIDVAGTLPDDLKIVLPVRDEAGISNLEKTVVVQAPALSENFSSIGQGAFNGTASNGTVTSGLPVSMPFVALATTSDDGKLIVYNAVSANGDGSNDYLIIENIEYYKKNRFSLFNRWGDKVFELSDYDNQDRVFRGKSNVSGEKDLGNGTYFYVIETEKDRLKVNGFLVLKSFN